MHWTISCLFQKDKRYLDRVAVFLKKGLEVVEVNYQIVFVQLHAVEKCSSIDTPNLLPRSHLFYETGIYVFVCLCVCSRDPS